MPAATAWQPQRVACASQPGPHPRTTQWEPLSRWQMRPLRQCRRHLSCRPCARGGDRSRPAGGNTPVLLAGEAPRVKVRLHQNAHTTQAAHLEVGWQGDRAGAGRVVRWRGAAAGGDRLQPALVACRVGGLARGVQAGEVEGVVCLGLQAVRAAARRQAGGEEGSTCLRLAGTAHQPPQFCANLGPQALPATGTLHTQTAAQRAHLRKRVYTSPWA